MKKNKWKNIGLILLTTIALIGTTACSKGNNSKETTSDEKTLKVSVSKDYIEYMNKIKTEFEKENDIKVEVTEKDMFDQMDALQLDGPAGKGPDVTMSPYDRVGQQGSQGNLAEVTLVDDRYSETDQQQVIIDDKVYGAPAAVEAAILFYNKDLISEAPTTFKELEEISKDSKFAEGDKNVGFLARWTDFYYTYGLLSGYGGYIFGDDGKDPSDVGLNNSGAIEGITYATDWFKNVWPQGMLDISSNENLMLDYFTNGKSAAIIYGPWGAVNFKEAGINYGVTKIPTLDNGKDYETFGGGKAWVVSNYAQDKEMAQKFLDFVTNDKNQEELYTMRNDVPANKQAQATVKEKDDPLATAVIEQYNVSQPLPNIPEMAEVWVGGENMMFDAGSGAMTPKESADNAVKTIKDAIEQKY